LIKRAIALVAAALETFCFSAAAVPDELDLPREHVSLVAPPFVHPHEQATNQGPKIVEFTLTVAERRMVIDD
jgi:nitrite reductase (NO-forming)